MWFAHWQRSKFVHSLFLSFERGTKIVAGCCNIVVQKAIPDKVEGCENPTEVGIAHFSICLETIDICNTTMLYNGTLILMLYMLFEYIKHIQIHMNDKQCTYGILIG